MFAKEVTADRDVGIASYVITIGRKAGNFTSKLEHVQSLGAYTSFPEHPSANDLRPLLTTVINAFLKGSDRKTANFRINPDPIDRTEQESRLMAQDGALLTSILEDNSDALPAVDYVDIIYTDFKSSISQETMVGRLLPAAFTEVPVEPDLENASFEPSAETVLNGVTVRLIEAQLYQALLESVASEQSARMLAMKNASDNASDIIDDLTLAFNTARQAAITQELAEITGGAEAIK
jgi:F-type H+-transporting ATPase subunit gamma